MSRERGGGGGMGAKLDATLPPTMAARFPTRTATAQVSDVATSYSASMMIESTLGDTLLHYV